jgi:hypothetical protein
MHQDDIQFMLNITSELSSTLSKLYDKHGFEELVDLLAAVTMYKEWLEARYEDK